MLQTQPARHDVGGIGATAFLTLIGVVVMAASLTLYLSHKGAAFGLIPGFMGLVLSLWGAVKLVRVTMARRSRGAA